MNRTLILTAAICTLVACNSSTGNRGGKDLVTINGETFTEGYLDFLGGINPRIKAQIGNPMGRKQIIDNLIEQELFYQDYFDSLANEHPVGLIQFDAHSDTTDSYFGDKSLNSGNASALRL